MVTAAILMALGLLTHLIVTLRNETLPCFSRGCTSCGHYLPPIDRPPALPDCPECQRLISLGVDLSDRLPPR